MGAQWANRDKVLANLARFPHEVTDAAVEQTEKEVNDLVAAEKRAAPVSQLEAHPGQLRDSISADKVESRVISWRLGVWARDSLGRLFARYVQFGHTAADGTWVSAAPWWFETYRARKKQMLARIRAAVRRRVKALYPES
jgi:hypothetical protein